MSIAGLHVPQSCVPRYDKKVVLNTGVTGRGSQASYLFTLFLVTVACRIGVMPNGQMEIVTWQHNVVRSIQSPSKTFPLTGALIDGEVLLYRRVINEIA